MSTWFQNGQKQGQDAATIPAAAGTTDSVGGNIPKAASSSKASGSWLPWRNRNAQGLKGIVEGDAKSESGGLPGEDASEAPVTSAHVHGSVPVGRAASRSAQLALPSSKGLLSLEGPLFQR